MQAHGVLLSNYLLLLLLLMLQHDLLQILLLTCWMKLSRRLDFSISYAAGL